MTKDFGSFDVTKASGQTGYTCRRRFEFVHEGNVFSRSCDKCHACRAKRKRDRSGRAAAQAALAAEVVVLTLTYKPGEPGALEFRTDDRSRLLKRIRSRQWRAARKRLGLPKKAPSGMAAEHRALIDAETAKIVFLGCGERGKRSTKRCHWHIVMFFDKPSGIAPSERDAKGNMIRENRDWWPHGFSTVDVLAEHTTEKRVRAARYCVKYLEKSREKEAVFFASNSKAYGAGWIEDEARRTARAGLPYNGLYFVPGVNFSRPNRPDPRLARIAKERGLRVLSSSSPPTPLQVQGSCCKYAAIAYLEEWRATRTAKPHATRFLQMHDPDYCAEDYCHSKRLPFEWAKHQDGPPSPLCDATDPKRAGLLVVYVGREVAGTVQVYETGAATFQPQSERFDIRLTAPHWRGIDADDRKWLPAGYLSQHLPFLGQIGRQDVERWLAKQRGPDWLSPPDRDKEARRRVAAQHAALLRLAQRSPRLAPDYLENGNGFYAEEPIAAVYRALRMQGTAYEEKAVRLQKGSLWRGRMKLDVERGGMVQKRGGWLGEAPGVSGNPMPDRGEYDRRTHWRVAILEREAEDRADMERTRA